jgi:hypothetical protein
VGTFADGIANGMLENRAASAESAASNARYAALDAERKLRHHQAQADQNQALLIAKIQRLSDDLRVAYDQRNVAVAVLRAIDDAMEEKLPYGELREKFRHKFTENSYQRLSELQKQGQFNDERGWVSVASKMTSVRALGIV